MTAGEARGHADRQLAERWDPVAAALAELQASGAVAQPGPMPLRTARDYPASADPGRLIPRIGS